MDFFSLLAMKGFLVGGGSGGGGGGSASIDVTASVGQTIVVEEVDANGKPTKWKAAEYQPKTHWSEETVILEETTLPLSNNIMFTPLAVPSAGSICKVTYNGTEYICEAADASEFVPGAVMFGNIDLAMETGDTGEPFLVIIAMAGEGGGQFVPLDESETFVLSIKGEVVTKLPAKYIPSLTNEFAIHFVGYPDDTSDGFNMQVTETSEAIYEALSNGKKIVGYLNCTYNNENIECVMHDYTINTPVNENSDCYAVTFGIWHAFFIPHIHKIRLSVGYVDGELLIDLTATGYDVSN